MKKAHPLEGRAARISRKGATSECLPQCACVAPTRQAVVMVHVVVVALPAHGRNLTNAVR